MIQMRPIVVLLFLVLLCSFSLKGLSAGVTDTQKNITTSVQDITLQDDAFHGRGGLHLLNGGILMRSSITDIQ